MEALPLPTDHSSSFRLFYDSVETHFRGLGSLGEKTETYWDILAPIIQKKLPNGIKKNLARQNGNKKWQIDNLRKAILNEIEILDQVRTVLVIMTSVATQQLLLPLHFFLLPLISAPPSEHVFSVRANIVQMIEMLWQTRERDTPLYAMQGHALTVLIVIQI